MPGEAPISIPAIPGLYAIIVLYNQSPTESAALSALLAQLTTRQQPFHLLVYDHSPQDQAAALPAHPALAYHHDPTNQGLAVAYNYALARARQEHCTWLLLLDQDTTVLPAYLQEAAELTASLAGNERVAAIVPKLASAKGIKSPTLDFLDWLRRQLQIPRRRALFATPETYGLQEDQFSAFNSGAILRVETMEQIGGFPTDFWLDFLDVAVFHALHRAGKRVYVMHASLQHELSLDTTAFYERHGALARYRNMLHAMARFVSTRGTSRDRLLTRLWLLRNALVLLHTSRDKRFSLASLKQAFVLKS